MCGETVDLKLLNSRILKDFLSTKIQPSLLCNTFITSKSNTI